MLLYKIEIQLVTRKRQLWWHDIHNWWKKSTFWYKFCPLFLVFSFFQQFLESQVVGNARFDQWTKYLLDRLSVWTVPAMASNSWVSKSQYFRSVSVVCWPPRSMQSGPVDPDPKEIFTDLEHWLLYTDERTYIINIIMYSMVGHV